MKMENAESLAKMLREQNEGMHFPDGAKEEDITEFEKKHNIKLPTKLREWLMYADGGNFFLPAGLQIYGVTHKPFINVDDDDRPNKDYIVIGRMSWGEPIVFKKGEENIAIYDHETGVIDDEVKYDDFFGFLKGLYDLLGIGE